MSNTTLSSMTQEKFTSLVNSFCVLLKLSDKEVAQLLETTVPNVKRWRAGKSVPAAAALVLKYIKEELDRTRMRVQNAANDIDRVLRSAKADVEFCDGCGQHPQICNLCSRCVCGCTHVKL